MAQREKLLSGKSIMVTGATAGIGEVTALELSRMGAEVILVGRDPEKCGVTTDRIRTETKNPQVFGYAFDLSSQAQILQLVGQLKSKFVHLDVLINNVGAVFPKRILSADGIEMTFALNHLGYFFLTNLLLDMLKESAPSRVVNVSSNGHFGAEPDFDDLELKQGYNAIKSYSRSKFANVLFTYELSRRICGTGVSVNALHPGLVKTNIGRSASWWMGLAWKLITLFSKGLKSEEGAETSIYLASSPDLGHMSGKYFVKKKPTLSDPATYDEADAKLLWDISAQMVGL